MCKEESVRGLTGYLTLMCILHATTETAKGTERMCKEESVRGLTGYLTLSSILHATTFFKKIFCMYANFCLRFLVLACLFLTQQPSSGPEPPHSRDF